MKALQKLESISVDTMTAPEVTDGPHYSDWRRVSSCIDFPELSALVRICSALPHRLEDITRILFKPSAITILEAPDPDLSDHCAHVLERGVLSLVGAEYDYLPQARVFTESKSSNRTSRSQLRKQRDESLPTELVSQRPTIVIVQNRVDLSPCLQAAATGCFSLPAMSRDEVNLLFRVTRGISLKAVLPDLLSKVPDNEALAGLRSEDLYAALRKPTSSDVCDALWKAVRAKEVEEAHGALDQVIGLGHARGQLEQIAEDLVSWKSGDLQWSDVSRGLLLYGQPGTGKTLCAQKLAEQCGAYFVAASYAEWQRHGHLGDFLAAMNKSFKQARENAPSILFLDEIDAFGDRKTAAGDNAHYTRSVVNALLEQLDGAGKHEGVFIVGACNYPEYLDDALVRSGRFDLKVEMPLPDKTSLVELLKLHLNIDGKEGSLSSLAMKLVGSSGADIAALVRRARGFARQRKRAFSITDLDDVVAASVHTLSGADMRRAALHEAGHAVVGYMSGKGVPTRARICAQGGNVEFASSGSLPCLNTLDAELATCLAGRASEEIFLGSASAGSGGPDGSDLAKATTLALQIEMSYGLGTSGLSWRPISSGNLTELMADKTLSDRVEQRLQVALNSAKSIVVEQRSTVETLAKNLIEQRELSGADMKYILLPETRTLPASPQNAPARQGAESQIPNVGMGG
ncbi:AAA family ATPase [Shimia thalassica]|uniref:AAA family ATPase n=1 Tax=Shimia thalassica TaxID=1715693 RepID=UPI0026E14B94|nr:AAA family ATPase [Shimia thalassica]MDO6481874.1 AAA family ATPase [Shimia thalassica]